MQVGGRKGDEFRIFLRLFQVFEITTFVAKVANVAIGTIVATSQVWVVSYRCDRGGY